jgi:hypothetical protein
MATSSMRDEAREAIRIFLERRLHPSS